MALAGPAVDGIAAWLAEHPDQLRSDWGWSFDIISSNTKGVSRAFVEPRPINQASRITILVLRDGTETPDSNKEVCFRYEVPLTLLRIPNLSHTLYNVRFSISPNDSRFNETVSLPLRVGYYGITGRNPLVRFREHRRDAENGRGHLLHKTWAALLSNCVDAHPVFQISAKANSLKEIYALEEEAVLGSLAPKGLNVIPGGEAGIRMLHTLRLLDSDRGVTPHQRDAALVALERGSAATHYRTGHIRRLSPERMTWVSPHWVNLDRQIAA